MNKMHIKYVIIIFISGFIFVVGSLMIVMSEMNNKNYYTIINYNELSDTLNSDGKIIVYFYKSNCQPCSKMKTIVNDYIKENNLVIYGIDITEESEHVLDFSEKYKIKYTPTVIIFSSKEEKDRLENLVDKAEFKQFIDTNINV